MGLWTLIQGMLLFANGLAILNEDRFLGPRGWTMLEVQRGNRSTMKGQLIGLIYACQYFRFMLILINFITIILKLIYG
ncbi:PREDICTED: protein transport protein yos1-like [Fragaria vesca subsp. vesca]|uniref:protein transport protein yos1-like n=1 Tax=Fragaria vesca subsp. vesca TaxID=101020 RepID=UPI0002C2F43F|nr:PREDICTED: protein transport protein yos1-like [Fragaria vesca subsp. vesca]XP_011466506.1 PREDICTED: protein transport protein yos1-like [Fragaria vesca subsp. vesca]